MESSHLALLPKALLPHLFHLLQLGFMLPLAHLEPLGLQALPIASAPEELAPAAFERTP